MHVRVSARATKEESRCEVRPTLSPSKRLTTFRPAPRTARSVAGFLGEKTSEGARTRRREGARGRRLVLRTQWAPPVPRRVPRRSRNATRRDASENGGWRGEGALGRAVCVAAVQRAVRQLQLLARYALDRRGTSLHGMCFLRFPSRFLSRFFLLQFALSPPTFPFIFSFIFLFHRC